MDLNAQKRAPIYEALEAFRRKRIVPFDVPGHKRGRGNPELVSLLGEVLHFLLPLPVPASVYGLILMLIFLCTGLIQVEQVRQAAGFLIEIMPVMFIPASVGLTEAWPSLKPVLGPVAATTLLTTVLVMTVTGVVTQFVIRRKKEGQ